jgi:lysine 2,3-aminomutase
LPELLQEQKEETRLMPGLVRTDEAVFNVPGMGENPGDHRSIWHYH